ncbi:MAG: NAD(P)H-dependent oxidoreductase [Pseudomonadota bacterium]
MAKTLLRIDASARVDGSITRDLTTKVIDHLGAERVITRDLAEGVPLLTPDWVTANFTPAADRSAKQAQVLAGSDAMVQELIDADTIVIGAPIYNFGVPAALKAWIDQVARAGLTFNYSAEGPKGLLENKRAIIVTASGGTKIGSEIDFAIGYLRHVLAFLGIQDVDVVAADQMALDAETSLATAETAVEALAA